MAQQTRKTDQRSSITLSVYGETEEEKEILRNWCKWVGDKLIEGHAVRIPGLGHVTLMRYKGTRTYSRHLTWELWKRDKQAFEERRKVQHPNLATNGERLGLKFYGLSPFGTIFKGKVLDKFKIRMTESFRDDNEKYKINFKYIQYAEETRKRFE